MPDEIDRTQDRMEREAEFMKLSRKAATLPYVGFCYNCNEPCSNRFCNEDCRDDWQRMQDAKQRNAK